MPSLSVAKVSNAQYAPQTRPVLVVFGGTSGIGAGIVRAFARNTHGRVHIVILGRSQVAADALIASLPKRAESQYEFERVDAVLMANVRKTCAALSARLPKINYLVLSQGAVILRAPDTAEGLPPLVAIGIYSRVRAALDLAPLLEKASASGEDARIMTVAVAGAGGPVNLDDIALKKAMQLPLWKMGQMRGLISSYSDIYTLESKTIPEHIRHARIPGIRRVQSQPRHALRNALDFRHHAAAVRALRRRLRRVHDVRSPRPRCEDRRAFQER